MLPDVFADDFVLGFADYRRREVGAPGKVRFWLASPR